ncbi:UNVERIFIED_CONTAM: hypothetical protein PYX00_007330 [Menopon gallinae]|uniref:serine--tRNA ligase n=1 Tax=Menopon gallinae TaxID=328185 RepID=A0AAW2HJJ0_9NEOP
MFQRTLLSVSRGLFTTQLCRSVERKPYSDTRKLTVVPEFDIEFIVDPANRSELEANIKKRKGIFNLDLIVELYNKSKSESDPLKKESILESLLNEACKLPNATHPEVGSSEPRTIKGYKPVDLDFPARQFHELAKYLGLLRTEELSNIMGRRSYFLIGELAELEHALIKFTISKLLKHNFSLISVPDILPEYIIDACGMNTRGERTQIFKLKHFEEPQMCLAGTSEIGLASLCMNSVFDVNDLPICFASVSRCHRAEISELSQEQGLYRVHQFTKVEMFGIAHPDKSEDLFHKFVDIQHDIFTSLGLSFVILDMPAYDLGRPAYRKFDMEAWFPGRCMYGEVSSCSNCTDFQSRRLNIKFRDGDELRHVHTVNGTACAIPRTVMALFETHQLKNKNVVIPEPLRPFMDGKEEIRKEKPMPAEEKKHVEL